MSKKIQYNKYKTAKKVESKTVIDTEYTTGRNFGSRYIQEKLSFKENMSYKMFKGKNKEYWEGMESDAFVISNGKEGKINEIYERVILSEQLIEDVYEFIETYEVFSVDNQARKITISYKGYNEITKSLIFKVILNKKRSKTDVQNLFDGMRDSFKDGHNIDYDYNNNSFRVIIDTPDSKIKPEYLKDSRSVFMGLDVEGYPLTLDLYNMERPHSLIIGQTGSGKSTFLENITSQLDYQKKKETFLSNKGKKILKKNMWKYKTDYEIWDSVKPKSHGKGKCLVNTENKIMEATQDLVDYIIQVNQGNEPEHQRAIFWEEFVNSINSIDKNMDRREVSKFKANINIILQTGRSAGVHLIFITQTINKSEQGLDGTDIPKSISNFMILKINAHVKNYVQNMMEVGKNIDLDKLVRGEVIINTGQEDKKVYWSILDMEDLEEDNNDNEEIEEGSQLNKRITYNF